MNWDHIESKWAAMTSRVRADVPRARHLDEAEPQLETLYATLPAANHADAGTADADALRAK